MSNLNTIKISSRFLNAATSKLNQAQAIFLECEGVKSTAQSLANEYSIENGLLEGYDGIESFTFKDGSVLLFGESKNHDFNIRPLECIEDEISKDLNIAQIILFESDGDWSTAMSLSGDRSIMETSVGSIRVYTLKDGSVMEFGRDSDGFDFRVGK